MVVPICKICFRMEPSQNSRSLHVFFRLKELNEELVGKCKFCTFLHQVIGRVANEGLDWNYCRVEVLVRDHFDKCYRWKFQDFHRNPICSTKIEVRAGEFYGFTRTALVSQLQNPSADVKQSLPWIKLKQASGLLEHTSSEAAVSWVKTQLTECIDHHKICKRAERMETKGQKRSLPKRLLDLRGKGDVRLREVGESEDEIFRYACLSHCWGQDPTAMFKTESTTLERFKQRIDWNQLPRIFREAINFLRDLKIEHLWIDSLCIVQASAHSPGDWSEECSKMADIYSNAILTIAATRAKDGSDTLFSPIATPISMDWEAAHWFVGEGSEHFLRKDYALGGEITRKMHSAFPLLSRAWVAQEMMLSPRVIHFCEGDIVWECMQHARCTCLGEPGRLKDALWAGQITPFGLAQLNDRIDDSGSTNERAFSLRSLLHEFHTRAKFLVNVDSLNLIETYASGDIFRSWQNLVQYYCGLGLSYSKDRLPAISGLARKFAGIYHCEYAAGLWLENIHGDLLWHSVDITDGHVSDEHLPTWSWAYNWRPVRFIGEELKCARKYLSVKRYDGVPLSRYDPFGQLTSAKLTVTGYLLSMQYEEDCSEEQSLKCGKVNGFHFEPDMPHSVLKEKVAKGSDIVGLPVMARKTRNYPIVGYVMGLALTRRQNTEYERVGVWQVGYDQMIDKSENWTIRLKKKSKKLRESTIVLV